MKQIPLKGNPNILEERKNREKSEIDLDYILEEDIVYPDLVFTLKQSPDSYFRPKVKYYKGRLIVVANRLSQRAAKEAGIEKISFDLSVNRQIPLEQLMEQFDLELNFEEAKKRDYSRRYLFFMQPPVIPHQNYPRIKLHSENDSPEYQVIHCVGYDLLLNGTYKQNVLSNRYFVKALVALNGPLRSWNGIKNWKGEFNGYFASIQ